MTAYLNKEIIGQKEAIETLVETLKRKDAGLTDAGRPTGSFLFIGPCGIGKTGVAKALAEFKRVLQPGGNLYISVPVDNENKVYFNAHRAFTRDYALELAKPMALIEEKYIYGREMLDSYDKKFGFGTGLYYFKKI